MLDVQVREGIAAMDEWDRLRLWSHWMIDHYTDNAKYDPSVRFTRPVSLTEFFTPDKWPSVKGPEWTLAHEYYQHHAPC